MCALSHLSKDVGEGGTCVVCGYKAKPGDILHQVVGLGKVCIKCGNMKITCESCGTLVRRITTTRFRGRNLCLSCYKQEREATGKRIIKEIMGDEREIIAKALEQAPTGYRFVGLRLKPNAKKSWNVEYELEDIYNMRCA